jgi:hypothetical protein
VFIWIIIDPNLANSALVESTISRVLEAIIDNALEMFKPLVLTTMMVFDAASRPSREGAEPPDLRRLGHDAYAPR